VLLIFCICGTLIPPDFIYSKFQINYKIVSDVSFAMKGNKLKEQQKSKKKESKNDTNGQ